MGNAVKATKRVTVMKTVCLRSWLTGIAAVAMTGMGMPSGAHAATYQLDYVPGTGVESSFGTVDISGTSTALTYTFNLTTGGSFINSGLTSFLFDVTGTVSDYNAGAGDVTCATAGCNGATFTENSFSYVINNTGLKPDGLGSGGGNGGWTEGVSCTSGSGSSSPCGNTFSITWTGTGLGYTFVDLNGVDIFAGADISCVVGISSPGSVPGNCTNDRTFQTGLVGATPLPGALALFFGPMLGGGYLLRRRRSKMVSAVSAAV